MAKIRVVLTIGRLERGGAELRLLRLIEDASMRGDVEIFIYVVSGRRGVLDEKFLIKNINIIYGRPGFIGLIGFVRFLLFLRPNVVHCNASLAGGLYCFTAWIAGVKIRISHIRTTEDYDTGLLYLVKKPIYQLFLNLFSTNVVGVCDGARNLSATPLKKWTTIYNGVDLDQAKFLRTLRNVDAANIVVFGRMHYAKNQVFAIEVLNSLNTKYSGVKWTLYFYGKEDPTIKNEINKKSNNLGIADDIRFCGESDNPLMTLSNYDVLLLPSVREGLPGVVLEAGAVGVPSVCSPLPGCREIARQFRYARTVNLTNADVWADEVFKLSTTDPELVAREFCSTGFDFFRHKEKIYQLWNI